MQNAAFLFMGVNDVSGGGGAERFFADFLSDYQKSDGKYKLFFIADKSSLKSFNAIDKLRKCRNVLSFNIQDNRFKNYIEFWQLAKLIVFNRIKLLQVPLYGIQYFEVLKRIDKLPAAFRPKIVITITDSFIPYYYFHKEDKIYNYKKIFGPLFESVKIDAVISWYQLFKDFSKRHNIIKSDPGTYVINSRYSSKIFPENPVKKNRIVYASRLTAAKQPLMLVEAVNILNKKKFNFSDWKFIVYGKGALESDIRLMVNRYCLNDLVEVTHHHDLTQAFSESKCFVSTQDFENFPSLAMNEAMAAGNVIIARNVGQTDLFVKDNLNGILLKEDNENGLAAAISDFISNPSLHQKMGMESVRLTKEVHTFSNFKRQIENFWDNILNKN
jgi:glycosyltransferase involved in cell wall biosynthesis